MLILQKIFSDEPVKRKIHQYEELKPIESTAEKRASTLNRAASVIAKARAQREEVTKFMDLKPILKNSSNKA